MDIVPVTSAQQLGDIRQLFGEYFDWVRSGLGIDLGYQGVQAELASLPGYFAPPRGRLLLAHNSPQPVGCVALRPMKDEGACELKRMYVRPAYRGQGLGKALAVACIAEARQIGYRVIRLDTADSLTIARGLYGSLGFCEVGPYYDVPPDVLKWTVFMEMSLA